MMCVPSLEFSGSSSLEECTAKCTTTTTTTAPAGTCGGFCQSDSDCPGDCPSCYAMACGGGPAPMAPPPPPVYACVQAPSGPACVIVDYDYPAAMFMDECHFACHEGFDPIEYMSRPARLGTASSPGCEGIRPGAVIPRLMERLVPEPSYLSDWETLSVDASVTVPVRVLEGRVNLPPFQMRNMRLQEYLEATVLSPPDAPGRNTLFLQQVDVFKYFAESAARAKLPWDGPGALCDQLPKARFTGYFVSAAGVSVPLHVDNGDIDGPERLHKSSSNLYLQLRGQKRFVLVPAGMPLDSLHPLDHGRWPHGSRAHEAVPFCQANETAMASWPGLADAWERRIEVELGPGDGLLIPSWWWHCTVALTDSAAINWWFDDSESETLRV